MQSLARHSTELYLDEVLQHHINHTVLTELHICIMSSVSTSSYNYCPKTASQHTHTYTNTVHPGGKAQVTCHAERGQMMDDVWVVLSLGKKTQGLTVACARANNNILK